MRTPFLGSAYSSRSPNLADQKLINLYPEIVESKSGKDVAAFYMCPGLVLLATAGSGPIRGAEVMQGVLYVVSGNKVFSVNANYMASLIGTMGPVSATTPVSMINNGSQLAIFDGANGYLVTSGALSTISLPFANPTYATYQDGFGLVIAGGTNLVYASNENDLSTWNALSNGQANSNPDTNVALADMHREVWILQNSYAEVWVNAGAPNFAFQRLQGVYIELGCAAAASLVNVGESLILLAKNQQGQGVVVQFAGGYTPQRISTHAIEEAIAKYPTISDAIAYSYQQEGHVFYVITFVSGNATWVLDMTTGEWHQRAALLNGVLNRHWGNAFAFFNGQCVVGDYLTGNLYAFDLNTFTDNGAARKWLRSWRALEKPTMKPVRFPPLQIDMETGAATVPPATNPQCVLRWSDDGGHNWSQPRYAPVGPIGKTAQRVKFNRIGSTRKNTGLDRIFELSSTDQFKVALIAAELVEE